MDITQWQGLLENWNAAILKNKDKLRNPLSEHLIEKGWLGNPGATDDQLKELEERLQTQMPLSYRNFLKITNGWNGALDDFIYKLWSTTEIDWFSKRNKSWIDDWTAQEIAVKDKDYFIYGDAQEPYNLRRNYLISALEISEYGDSAILLLNPQVRDKNGEWEAWFFANWLPGAKRYRSFGEMMTHRYEKFIDMMEEE